MTDTCCACDETTAVAATVRAWTAALADHNRLVERQVRAGVVSS
ncbi:MAG: hypothetical protein ACJ74F_15815 [Mycobacterium sp.]